MTVELYPDKNVVTCKGCGRVVAVIDLGNEDLESVANTLYCTRCRYCDHVFGLLCQDGEAIVEAVS